MDVLETPPQRIIINGNVTKAEGRGQIGVYRVLAVTPKYCHVIKLGTDIVTNKNGILETVFQPLPPNTKTRARKPWSRDDYDRGLANGSIKNTYEHGIPAQMKIEIPEGANPELDTKRSSVKAVETFAGDRLLEDGTLYTQALTEVANRFAIGVNTVRERYEKHLFYGGHPNALMDHYWLRGGPGQSRRYLRVRLGNKTTAEKDIKGTKHTSRRLKDQVYSRFRNFIKDQVERKCFHFPTIFHRWITSRIATTRNKDGDIVRLPIDEKNFQNDDHVKRLGRNYLKKLLNEMAAGKQRRTGSRGGHATDIVHAQLPVWDIDSTVADNFLKFGNREISVEGVGKPTVTLVTCRGSGAIPGWHVSFGPENGDAYLNAVFCASTDKYRELFRWNMTHLYDGMVYGCASEVFLDRGPGVSMRTQTTLVERFRAAAKMAQPGTPEGKGNVEQVMRYFQDALRDIAGSIFKVGDDDEDWMRRKVARENAVTIEQFMQALLTAIYKRNIASDVQHLLTPDMIKSEVPASPKDIFQFCKKYTRGDVSWDCAPEDVFERLCVKTLKKAPKGIITLDKRTFTSTDLQFHTDAMERLNNGRTTQVNIYEIPNAPFLLLWELPGGGKGILEATKNTQRMFEDGGMFSIKFQNNLKKHLFAEARWASRRDVIQANIIATDAVENAKTSSRAEVSNERQDKLFKTERRAENVVPGVSANDTARQKAKAVSDWENGNAMASVGIPGYVPPVKPKIPVSQSRAAVSSIDNTQLLFEEDDED
ncbi:hypothetical protein HBH1_02091 [Herbaspirillum sp. BH-1]|uniref:hypothetical protein n=1 Tax=Herbaspirillum sp. (strain BH-1) TaxID=2058884 RepID=UPI000C88832D|nr:hypothetical protein [Herbaspirillum sp. BH-1]PLY59581.1 hypothetical protein HBH1_02091 [Herbaspirillum sp. BH-1]